MFRFLLIAVVIGVAFVLRVYGRAGGRLFGLAFTNLTSGSVAQTSVFEEIHVSSFHKTTLFKVIVPQLDFEQVYSLDCGNNWSKTITFAQDIATLIQDLTYPLAVVVASQNFSINVQVSKALPGSTGGYLAMPLFNRAGNSYGYYVPSYSCNVSTLSIVTVQNSTAMSIVKEVNGDGSNFVKLMNRTMQANDVMNWFSNGSDYTGLRVSSNKPLAVFGGCTCAQVPNGTASCDYVFEQIPEYNSLYGSGSATPRVILASVPGRPFGIGFNFRIIASTGAPYVTVSRIREFRYNLSESSTAPRETINLINAPLKVYCTHHVEFTAGRANNTNNLYTVVIVDCSDDACEVMQYNPGNDILSVNDGSDPYMQFTCPLYRYTSDITFSTSKINKNGTLSSARNFLTVISAVSAVNTLQLDTLLIENSTNFSGWITLPANETNFNNFRVGWLPITDGFHTLTTTDNQAGALYTAYVTGHGDPSYPTAYGYLAGYDNLDSGINTVPSGPWYDMSLPPGTTTDVCTTLPVTTTTQTTEASIVTTIPRSEGERIRVTDGWPLFGPEAGGTTVTINGQWLNISTVSAIYLGDSLLAIYSLKSSSFYSVVFVTPSTNITDTPLAINLRFTGLTSLVETGLSFTYRPNPVITDINPKEHLIDGGTNITVTGKNLDSAAEPVINVSVEITESGNVSFSISTNTEKCTRRKGDTVNITCLMPPLNLTVDITNSILGNITENSTITWSATPTPGAVATSEFPNGRLDVYVGLAFDGFKYDSINSILPNITMTFQLPPVIEARIGSVLTFDPAVQTTLSVPGKHMNRGCRMVDYVSKVGVGICENVDLSDNQYLCRPPSTAPSRLNNDTMCNHPYLSLSITIGFRYYHYGCLQYKVPSPFNKLLLLYILLALVIIIPLVIGVAVCIRRKCSRTRRPEKPADKPSIPFDGSTLSVPFCSRNGLGLNIDLDMTPSVIGGESNDDSWGPYDGSEPNATNGYQTHIHTTDDQDRFSTDEQRPGGQSNRRDYLTPNDQNLNGQWSNPSFGVPTSTGNYRAVNDDCDPRSVSSPDQIYDNLAERSPGSRSGNDDRSRTGIPGGYGDYLRTRVDSPSATYDNTIYGNIPTTIQNVSSGNSPLTTYHNGNIPTTIRNVSKRNSIYPDES